jgi:RNA 2',3'-cyclic 3'-phosphodiesterase
MRLFVALDIADEIRERIERFMGGVKEFAPAARWVYLASLHITLKFIGEKPVEELGQIKAALAGIQASVLQVTFRGYGFFPTPKSARVFWVGIESSALPTLVGQVDLALSRLGIPKEDHPYTPHLTLARRKGGSGSPHTRFGDRSNLAFRRLQEKLAPLSPPEFGTMTAREFHLYQSQLSPGGSRYTKLERFDLR